MDFLFFLMIDGNITGTESVPINLEYGTFVQLFEEQNVLNIINIKLMGR